MDKKKVDIDRVFQALGDPTRRAMLERLSPPGSISTPMSVSRLGEPFNMSLAAVVQHLQILETGRVRSCRVEAAGLRAAEEWLRARRPEWDRRLDRLGDWLTDAGEDSEK